ncbi:hypothetical protein B7494_g2778 [Chlorociboria aeruginascens]|nr:hypothetical protein B7494_g2778 [Chlorociboria aeruginascens]
MLLPRLWRSVLYDVATGADTSSNHGPQRRWLTLLTAITSFSFRHHKLHEVIILIYSTPQSSISQATDNLQLQFPVAMDFPLPWKHWSLQSAVFATATACRYIDVLLYPDRLSFVDEGELNSDAAVLDWLDKDLRRLAHTSPIGGLRLLYGGCRSEHTDRNDIIPFTYTLFREMSVRFGIPRQFEKCIALRSPQSSSFSHKDGLSQPLTSKYIHMAPLGFLNDGSAFIFKMGLQAIGYFSLVLSYNEDTRITHAILLAQTVYNEFPRLVEGLKFGPELCLHPLFIVIGLEEIITDIGHEKLDLANKSLDRLEDLMGLHPFRNRFVGDPLKIDFVWATRTLNSISTMVGVTGMRICAAQVVLEKWSRYSEQLNLPHLSEKPRTQDAELWQDVSVRIGDQVEYLSDLCRNLLLRKEFEQQRTQTQLSVVYNYMSQKDALVNIDIATETKKDSSAMKTIAVLTMVFLPGTFVAAFYAMPLFDWDAAPGSSVLKDRFNYYWIATFPLTIIEQHILHPAFAYASTMS